MSFKLFNATTNDIVPVTPEEEKVNGTIAGTVSYSYKIPGKESGEGKCTLWLQEGEYATDVYEVIDGNGEKKTYTVTDKLYVAADGVKLTNAGTGTEIGYVTKVPVGRGNPFLQFYLKNDPYKLEQ